jgi:hypothetical protein
MVLVPGQHRNENRERLLAVKWRLTEEVWRGGGVYSEFGGAGGGRSSRHACRSACDVGQVVGRPVLLFPHACTVYGLEASLNRRHLAGKQRPRFYPRFNILWTS